MTSRLIVVLVVVCVLSGAGCGQPTDTTTSAVTDPTTAPPSNDPSTTDVPNTSTTLPTETTSPSTPPSSVPLHPEPVKIPPSPSLEALQERIRNHNVRDGGIGSVCWARKELVLGFNESFGSTLPAAEANAELALRLSTIIDELRAAENRLPEQVAQFTEHLVLDAEKVREAITGSKELPKEAVPKAWVGLFAYDEYAGREAYLDLASSSESCEPAET